MDQVFANVPMGGCWMRWFDVSDNGTISPSHNYQPWDTSSTGRYMEGDFHWWYASNADDDTVMIGYAKAFSTDTYFTRPLLFFYLSWNYQLENNLVIILPIFKRNMINATHIQTVQSASIDKDNTAITWNHFNKERPLTDTTASVSQNGHSNYEHIQDIRKLIWQYEFGYVYTPTLYLESCCTLCDWKDATTHGHSNWNH